MAANSALVVSSLDFDTIRGDLVEFLKTQAQFRDFDYAGSNISVLLDLMAYNTYMSNFYTNMAISEMFLDSAQLRDSVVSRAKELNYTPRSVTSAEAKVDITISPSDSPASIVIPKGTAFNARIDSDVFTFTTDEALVVTQTSNYTAANVSIFEGAYVTETFVVDSSIEDQRYILTSVDCDISSIGVEIQESVNNTTTTEYVRATTLLGTDSTSKIFFVQASDKNRYELIFGDNTFGSILSNGNVVRVTYRISKGSLANGATTFKAAGTVAGYTAARVTLTTVINARNGAEQESLKSIKYNAPRHYQTQERAVTVEDYKTILFQQYPDIRALNVYGGETVSPPQYGKVFIAIDLDSYDGIPTGLQDEIASFIQTKSPITINPVVVESDYTYVDVVCDVMYNINVTTKTINDIADLVSAAVRSFNDTYLNNFNIKFRYSKLVAAIDNSHSSIVSTNLITMLIKKIAPTVDLAETFSIDFQNALVEGSLVSDNFTYNNVSAYIKSLTNGTLVIATTESGTEVTINSDVGLIDFSTGIVTLKLPAISAYQGNHINIKAETISHDSAVYNNKVLLISDDDITVNAQAIRE